MNIPHFVLLAAMSVPAIAQEVDGEPDRYFPQQLSASDLLAACASSSLTATGRTRQRYCLGFLSGVEETFRLLQLPDASTGGNRLCAPDSTSARTLANVFVRHASEPGVDLNRPAAMVVLDALKKGFPC